MAKPLVGEAIAKILIIHSGAWMLFYRAVLLSARTLTYTAGMIPVTAGCSRAGGRVRGSTATAWRYATETVSLPAARAPKLRPALAAARKAGHAYVVIDGTLIAIDRVAADRHFYSGKHRRQGMNLQVISGPDGEILWVSGALPSAIHDLTAARSGASCGNWPDPG